VEGVWGVFWKVFEYQRLTPKSLCKILQKCTFFVQKRTEKAPNRMPMYDKAGHLAQMPYMIK
jgi:hypothetical protein